MQKTKANSDNVSNDNVVITAAEEVQLTVGERELNEFLGQTTVDNKEKHEKQKGKIDLKYWFKRDKNKFIEHCVLANKLV